MAVARITVAVDLPRMAVEFLRMVVEPLRMAVAELRMAVEFLRMAEKPRRNPRGGSAGPCGRLEIGVGSLI